MNDLSRSEIISERCAQISLIKKKTKDINPIVVAIITFHWDVSG
jgi:hypothetical protein